MHYVLLNWARLSALDAAVCLNEAARFFPVAGHTVWMAFLDARPESVFHLIGRSPGRDS